MFKGLFLIFFSMLLMGLDVSAQAKFDTVQSDSNLTVKDSIKTVKRHSPAKAALLSAVLPGAGQVYNRKYWKVSVVYAGLIGIGYWANSNRKNWRCFKKAYQLQIDDDPNTVGECQGISNVNQLQSLRNSFKTAFDVSVLVGVGWYALNILDATVDAHLFEYDISDDLSIHLYPVMQLQGQSNSAGLAVNIQLKQ